MHTSTASSRLQTVGGLKRTSRDAMHAGARCAKLVSLKQMLATEVRPLEAPRSFRLTPELLGEAEPAAPATGGLPWMPRAAQAIGGVAVAMFAVFAVVDLAGTESRDDGGIQASAGDAEFAAEPSVSAEALNANDGGAAAPESAGADAPAASDPLPAEDADESTAATQLQPEEGRGAGGGGPGEGGTDAASELRSDGGGGVDWLLVAQVASGIVALAAGGAFLFSRRSIKE